MNVLTLDPLDEVQIPDWVMALPKTDVHVHAEGAARLERVLAHTYGPPTDWRAWAERLMREIPPGMQRLQNLGPNYHMDHATVDRLDAEPANVTARIEDLLSEGAADGAVLIEVIFGPATILLSDFMMVFREAERRVQARYPQLHAEAIIATSKPTSNLWIDVQLPACLAAARDGLAGINIISDPYDDEMDWAPVYRWAPRAVDLGLGLTAHAGEFSTANLAATLQVPGLTRIGHGVYLPHDPWLLEQAARNGITVECSLSCNVVLGAAESYETHPIRQLIAAGISVTLSTDDPVRIVTTIGREYAIAALLGFTEQDLLGFTQNGVRAAFTAEDRRQALLKQLHES
jgi:adenosine deaminase